MFSHKGLWIFCLTLRGGVSKQRALPESSRVTLLQFANDISMQDNAQNMVSCCNNRRVLHQSAGRRIVRVPNVMIRQNDAKVACHSIFNVLPPTSSNFILCIYFSSISPGHTLQLVFHGLPPDGRSLHYTEFSLTEAKLIHNGHH